MAIVAGVSQVMALRLGPGEDVPARLMEELDAAGAGGASLVTAVGSLGKVEYVTALRSEDGVIRFSQRRRYEEPLEIGSLVGHLGRDENGQAGFHFHGLFARASGQVVGGHVYRAEVLLTLEVTLLLGEGLDWRIVPFTPPQPIRVALESRAFVPFKGNP
jgi:predicted DNA-binding protein with PD1-like motif